MWKKFSDSIEVQLKPDGKLIQVQRTLARISN